MKNFIYRVFKTKFAIYLIVILGIILAGFIDSLDGKGMRLLVFYLFPLLLAGWYLGQREVIFCSFFATIVWAYSLYARGGYYLHWSLWIINFLIQGLSLLMVPILIAKLRDSLLKREEILSHHDSLTGLINKRAFIELTTFGLALCKRRHSPVSLVYIDLNNFKKVNDDFGYYRGDLLLKHCAKLILSSVRATDIVARLGDDEFAIFLTDTDDKGAATLLDRLQINLKVDAAFQLLQVTASIGLLSMAETNDSINGLIAKANQLMYEAKKQGKNSIQMSN